MGNVMSAMLRSEQKSAYRQKILLVGVLWCLVIVSSLMIVFSSHDARAKFNELEVLRVQQDKLQIVWSQYLLEESAWASFGRVEKIAIEQLSMEIPTIEKIIMVNASEN